MRFNNIVKGLRSVAFFGVLAGCSNNTSSSTAQVYEGTLLNYGHTSIIVEGGPNSHTIVWIESMFLNKPELPYKRHALVDEEGDGKFDSGTYPYKLSNTSCIMSRKVSRSNNPQDFFALEKVVLAALSERNRALKKTN